MPGVNGGNFSNRFLIVSSSADAFTNSLNGCYVLLFICNHSIGLIIHCITSLTQCRTYSTNLPQNTFDWTKLDSFGHIYAIGPVARGCANRISVIHGDPGTICRDGKKKSRAKSGPVRLYKESRTPCELPLFPILPVISSSCPDDLLLGLRG